MDSSELIMEIFGVKKGFSFVETLMAIFILAVGSIALAQLLTTGVWLNARTKDDSQISTVAQRFLEQLYDSRYANLTIGGDLYNAQTNFSLSNVKIENDGSVSNSNTFHQNEVTYDIYWQVLDGGSVANVPCKEIAVRVVCHRMPMGGSSREVIVRSQISRLF